MIKLIEVIDNVIYYNILGELVYFKLNSLEYTNWLRKLKGNKAKIKWLRGKGLID